MHLTVDSHLTETCGTSAPLSVTLSVSEVDQRLRQSALQTMEAIVKDKEARLRGCLERPGLLNSGIFTADAYFNALQELRTHYETIRDAQKLKGVTERIDCLIRQGAFHHGLAEKECFVQETEQKPLTITGKKPYSFFLKKGSTPTQALLSLIGTSNNKKFYILGCTAITQLAYIKALFDLLGSPKCDSLFAAERFYRLEFTTNRQSIPLLPLLIEYRGQAKEGDWIGIPGPKGYFKKHWNGNSGYWNVLLRQTQSGQANYKSGQANYIGFDLPQEGISHKNLLKLYVTEFNKKPSQFDRLSEAHIQRMKLVHQENPKEMERQITLIDLKKERSEMQYDQFCFNAARVHELMCASIDQAHALMTQWLLELKPYIDHVIDFTPLIAQPNAQPAMPPEVKSAKKNLTKKTDQEKNEMKK